MFKQQFQNGTGFGARFYSGTLKRRALLLILLIGIIFPVLGMGLQGEAAATPRVIDAEGACIAWNINGQWQYRASLGGYGTMTFIQDGAGNLTGSWHNVANGGSGSLTGDVKGAAVNFDPSATETFVGTVAPDGKKIAGTFTFGAQIGTWEATGSAECTRRQPAPVVGTARINVRWGPHLYRRILRSGAGAVTTSGVNQPQLPPGVPVITFLGQTTLEIEVIYYGDNLPNSLTVFDRVEGVDVVVGSLTRVGETADGGVIYRGTVSVSPRGPIAPGRREVHDVMLVDPLGNEVFISRIDMNLIDPSGYIYDAQTDEKIEGAVASCFVRQGGNWLLWDAEMYGQVNPQASNDVGHYGWDVPQGDYKVRVSKPCYQDAESAVVTVPPPRTDVHFALQPLTCSPVTVADIWTADSSDIPAIDFRPGQEVGTHIVVDNTGIGDASVTITWSTRGPNGAFVKELSGSGGYVVQPGDAIDAKVGGTVPKGAQEGTHTLTAQLTYNQQTSLQVTRFQVVSGAMINLPVIMKDYQGTQPQGGITGRVTEKGAAAANVPLTLRFYDGDDVSDAATTKTDAKGNYRFTGIDSLGENEVYYIRFGPNESDPDRLAVFFGNDISDYSSGTQVDGGDFDIGDVDLLEPKDDAAVPLPVTFAWKRRNFPGDSYRVVLFSLDSNDAWITDDLGDTDSITINSLPPDVARGKPYGWYVEVYNGPDSYGESFDYREVIFKGSIQQAPDRNQMPGFVRRAGGIEDRKLNTEH